VTAAPSFSVIVPTRNRPVRLAECLRALASLDYPAERLETIVVDDGSATARDVVDRAEMQRVIVVEQTTSGPAAARNRGAAEAGGAFVAFLDDDCSPVPTWLADLQSALKDDPKSLVGGPTVNALTTNAFAAASQTVVDYLVVAGGRTSGDDVSFLPSSNLALAREAFLALGGFDTRFTMAGGEDRELCERARASGHRLRFIQSAVVTHRHDLGPATFWRQHYRYGRGAYRLRRGQHDRVRKLVPERLSFYTGLVRSPQRGALPRRKRALVAALLAVSQLATACGVIHEALSRSPPHRGRQPAGPKIRS
jgi:GT2 family glycosyltransferase